MKPRYIQKPAKSRIKFSVCSLVNDVEQYQNLLESFQNFGFNKENSEFLVADNRKVNQFDGYDWQRRLYAECRGEYVIFCHDDISLIDNDFNDLVARLEELDAIDPNWLLAGVAGALWQPPEHFTRRQRQVLIISDRYGSKRRMGVIPARVEALDECIIIMKRHRPIFGSYDLSGFHFYGADMCLMAEIAGGSAYVIDFHLHHGGDGQRGPAFREARKKFIAKYAPIFPGRTVSTTSEIVHLPEIQNDWAQSG